MKVHKTKIREYADELDVEIHEGEVITIFALNESGYSSTSVNLKDVIKWVKENMPELISEVAI